MIEAAVVESAPAPLSATVPPEGVTAGGLLRDAREAAGLHVAALAASLKVPVGKLEALEHDRYELLPDAVFTRALASAICRNLKIDPAPVLERLPRTATPRLVQDTDGINAPFRSPRDGIAPNWREHLTRPVSLIVAALLLGALVVILWPATPVEEGAVATGEQPAVAATPGPAPEAPPAAARPTDLSTTSTLVSGSVALPAPAAVSGRTSPVAEPAAAAPAAAAASAVAAPATAASGVVVFRTSGAAWIEVRDANGVVAVRKLMAPGESAGAAGAMPLQVIVGRVDATQVQVRGKPFDLRPFARDNVARFEVK